MNLRQYDGLHLIGGLLARSEDLVTSAERRSEEVIDISLPQGRRIRVRRWRGRGTPLVALHGLLDTSEGWRDLAQRINRPIIAFDLPGFGGSSLPENPEIASYAVDVKYALKKLGVRKYALVGHSLGGAVAASLAEKSPDAVKKLVLIAPAGFGKLVAADLVSLPGLNQLAKHSLPLFLKNSALVTLVYAIAVSNHKKPNKDLINRLKAANERGEEGAARAVKALRHAGHSKRAFYRRKFRYSGPVLLIWGDCDQLIPSSHLENAERSIPQLQRHVFNDVGHHPQNECPELFARVTEEFLT